MKRRGGGSKAKGAEFERNVCKSLSAWVTHGEREDCFWRSAMSGGRATVGKKKGKDLQYQAGDICAVHPRGHVFTDYWYVECKFIKDLKLGRFVASNIGPTAAFWKTAKREARSYGRVPMLIARANTYPTLVVIQSSELDAFDWARRALIATVGKKVILSFDAMLECRYSSRVRMVKP